MQKNDLKNLIERYWLAGYLTKDSSSDWQPTLLKFQNNIASVETITGDRSTLITVNQNIEFEDCEIAIGNTKQFLSILNSFGSEITLKVKPNSVSISDNDLEATIALADQSSLPEPVKLKVEPSADVVMVLNRDFIDRFNRAKKALSDSTLFAIFPDTFSNQLDFVINYHEDQNINNIKVIGAAKDVTINDEFDILYFNSNTLVSIFAEHDEYRNATLKLSKDGLMTLNFVGEDFESTYHIKALSK